MIYLVLTEKDLLPSKPIIKKPRSFNPIGAIVTGIILASAHTILYRSFWGKDIHVGFSVFGFLLLMLAIIGMYFLISLSAKYIAFVLKVEQHRTKSALIMEQALLAYLGFVPSYGFLLVYSTQGISMYTLLITIGTFILLFTAILYRDFEWLVKNKISLGYLLQWKYYPNIRLLAGISMLIVFAVTGTFFLSCLI